MVFGVVFWTLQCSAQSCFSFKGCNLTAGLEGLISGAIKVCRNLSISPKKFLT